MKSGTQLKPLSRFSKCHCLRFLTFRKLYVVVFVLFFLRKSELHPLMMKIRYAIKLDQESKQVHFVRKKIHLRPLEEVEKAHNHKATPTFFLF